MVLVNDTWAPAEQVFDGVMLGAAGLVTRLLSPPRFEVELGQQHGDLAAVIKSSLIEMGIVVSDTYPRLRTHFGEQRYTVVSSQIKSAVLSAQYSRWYSGGKKRVPLDIELTPIVLAFWYMVAGFYSIKMVGLSFSVGKYRPRDLEILRTRLEEQGLKTGLYERTRPVSLFGGALTRSADLQIVGFESSYRFYTMVRPYILDSFMYKLPG